eukprot:PhF_6_TR3318/c0_g1_i1/m.4682
MAFQLIQNQLDEIGFRPKPSWFTDWYARSRNRTVDDALTTLLHQNLSLTADPVRSVFSCFPVVFQVNEIEDVSRSVMDRAKQHAKNEDSSANFRSRVIKMVLTDGVKMYSGVEASVCVNLSLKMQPGCKIRILRDVEKIHDVFVFTSSSVVTHLGGSVLSLCKENHRKWNERVEFVMKRGAMVSKQQPQQTQVQQQHASVPASALVLPAQPQPAPPNNVMATTTTIVVLPSSESSFQVLQLSQHIPSPNHRLRDMIVLRELTDHHSNGEVRFRGIITRLIGPLRIHKDEALMSLSCVVDDGTSTATLRLSHVFLEQLIGMPFHDFVTLTTHSPEDAAMFCDAIGYTLSVQGYKTFVVGPERSVGEGGVLEMSMQIRRVEATTWEDVDAGLSGFDLDEL